MLTIYRRHRAGCRHRSRRLKGCFCPIWVQGTLKGEKIRKALDLGNWEAAQRKVRDWEVEGLGEELSVRDACDKFVAEREGRRLSPAMLGKYKRISEELKANLGDRQLRSISVDDIRGIMHTWKLASVTTQKRLEMYRKFFKVCVDSGWTEKNPAKAIEGPMVDYDPTLPFTKEEMARILKAADTIRETHPKMPEGIEKKLKGLILLMRYSGIRISDAVMFRRDQLKNGKLFLRQAKTKHMVWVPLPKKVIKALKDCDPGGDHFFYNGIGKIKTCITEWQERLKKVYVKAGLEDGHSHRLRDTFAVNLLDSGVPLETVSILLGHQSIKTTEKHYAPWVQSRQAALEKAVKMTWA
jgi:integrase/recombinase XerD